MYRRQRQLQDASTTEIDLLNGRLEVGGIRKDEGMRRLAWQEAGRKRRIHISSGKQSRRKLIRNCWEHAML